MQYKSPLTEHIYKSAGEVLSDYNCLTKNGENPEEWEETWAGRTNISQQEILNTVLPHVFIDPNNYLTTQKFSEKYSIGLTTVKEYIARGEIIAEKVNNSWRIADMEYSFLKPGK